MKTFLAQYLFVVILALTLLACTTNSRSWVKEPRIGNYIYDNDYRGIYNVRHLLASMKIPPINQHEQEYRILFFPSFYPDHHAELFRIFKDSTGFRLDVTVPSQDMEERILKVDHYNYPISEAEFNDFIDVVINQKFWLSSGDNMKWTHECIEERQTTTPEPGDAFLELFGKCAARKNGHAATHDGYELVIEGYDNGFYKSYYLHSPVADDAPAIAVFNCMIRLTRKHTGQSQWYELKMPEPETSN